MATGYRLDMNLNLSDDYDYQEIENIFIPLKDGTKLSAKIWLPKDYDTEKGVPAVFEFLPYRKRDMTTLRDEITYPYFAHHGYAGVRVDMRGCGDSTGITQDEYNAQEIQDGLEVLDWIAEQNWCDGNIGMMGISWGGFNSVQIAYHQPKHLKAIIPISFTTDRYNDDIHYKGGAMLLSNTQWASCMTIRNCLPPDTMLSPDDWQDKFTERLENIPRLNQIWLENQTRNAYWKYGSVCEDFSKITIPVFMIAGYNDGYTNAVYKLMDGIKPHSPCVKALIGPWVHLYPHIANPQPAWSFLENAKLWWDKWLKGIDNGIENTPEITAYINDCPKSRFGNHIDGRFVADTYPSTTVKNTQFSLDTIQTHGGIHNTENSSISICSPETTGFASGVFFPFGPDEDFPMNQSFDDANSIVFDLPHFDTNIEVLGVPSVTITASADKKIANMYVRLSVVHPDGDVRRIAYMPINMNHLQSQETVTELTPHQKYTYDIPLDFIGETVHKDCKIRIAISSAYFPMCWSNPQHTTVTIYPKECHLTLPMRTVTNDIYTHPYGDNVGALPKPTTQSGGTYKRTISIDAGDGSVCTTLIDDMGTKKFQDHGLSISMDSVEHMTIHPTNSNSAILDSTFTAKWHREGFDVQARQNHTLTSDVENFYLHVTIDVQHNGKQIWTDTYKSIIKRQGI